MGQTPPGAPKRFYRTTRTDAKIAGVCGGIARYFGWDPTLVRILSVVIALFSAGSAVIAYIVFWIAAPSEDTLQPPAPPAPAPVYR